MTNVRSDRRRRTSDPGAPTPEANARLGTSASLKWLRADSLIVDPAYQRAINERKVRTIARAFDPDAFGVLYVSQRTEDGRSTYYVIDGLQRHSALMLMEWGDQRVPCHVYEGLTQQQEAALFAQFNEVRTKPRPIDLHRAALVAGDPRAVDIDTLLRSHNLRVGAGPQHGSIQSVGTLHQVYDSAGLMVLDRTLTVISKAWGNGADSFHGDIVVAVAALLSRYDGRLDEARLARALGRLDPTGVVRKARVMKAEFGMAGGSANPRLTGVLGGIIAKEYNSGRVPEGERIDWDTDLIGPAFWKSVV